MKKLIYSLGLAVFAVFLVAGMVQAATTIGTAISTGSTLSVTGASTLTGATTVTGALYGNGGLDRSTAAALAIGATNATSVTITPATTITGAATLSSTLGVTSDVTVDTNTLKVDATNNFVGVGTTTPKSNLSISTSAGTAPTVRLLDVASTTGASLFKVLASGASTFSGTLAVTGAVTLTAGLTIDTNTLIVDATNNFVGVGTTTPKSNLSVSTNAATTPATRLFNVASTTGAALFTVLASGNTSVAGTLAVTGATTLTAGLTIDTNTLIVDATNNFVGVGTTTPKSNLSISTSASTAPTVRLLEVASTTGASLFKVLANGAATHTGTLSVTGATTLTADLTVDTNTLRVDATNNYVGVGTTTPKSNLSISTSGQVAPATRLLTVASTTGTTLLSVLASGNLVVDTDTLFVDAANNRVGVASSTPRATFSVGGNSASSTIDISKMCIQTSTTAGVRYHIYLKADGSLGTQVGNCP